MTTETQSVESLADREITLTRLYDAPREMVFDAWTAPERISRWWGPNGFTTTTLEMNAIPGGTWRFIMHGPDGVDYDNRIVYSEVTRPECLVYVHGHDIDDDPQRFHVTVTFTEQEGKTEVTMHTVLPSAEERARVVAFGAIELGKQTLSRLDEYLARD